MLGKILVHRNDMFNINNDLPSDARTKAVSIMNQLLAEAAKASKLDEFASKQPNELAYVAVLCDRFAQAGAAVRKGQVAGNAAPCQWMGRECVPFPLSLFRKTT